MKELKVWIGKYAPLGKSFISGAARLFILLIKRSWAWIDKPHTIRIKKKTIIIGVIILCLLYASVAPTPGRIVYAGGNKPSPLIPKIPVKKPTLPQTHLEAAQTVQPIPTPTPPTPAPIVQSLPANYGQATLNCGDNTYANFIYMHESGCNTWAINPSSGAGGIGQALPFSKTGCALGDYACQNAWFTGYANSAYGGWYGAYLFWVAHSWW